MNYYNCYQRQPARRNYTWQILTVFIGFLIFGFSENIRGPAIPRIQTDFSLSEMQIGTLLSLNSLGYLLACSFTAILVRKWGIKITSLLAFGSMAASGIFIFYSHSYSVLSGSYFLMYIGNGMLEIALAILGAQIFVKNTGTMMNLSHFFYGLSSTVAPIIASELMTVTVFGYTLDWRGMYFVMLRRNRSGVSNHYGAYRQTIRKKQRYRYYIYRHFDGYWQCYRQLLDRSNYRRHQDSCIQQLRYIAWFTSRIASRVFIYCVMCAFLFNFQPRIISLFKKAECTIIKKGLLLKSLSATSQQ